MSDERKVLSVLAPEDRGEGPVGLKKRGRGWEIGAKRLDTLHDRAREMRRHPTPAQTALVAAMEGRDAGGYTFRRQDVIGSAIVDFACKPLMLVIELDGDDDAEFTATREQSLVEVGYKVVRLPAADVLADPDGTATRVIEIMRERWHERRAKARPARPAPRTGGRPGPRTSR